LQILSDSISQETTRNFYLFDGSPQSYITLKTPIELVTRGLCWTGYIRVEDVNNPNKIYLKRSYEKQCIFSFINQKETRIKGFELMIEGPKLVYYIINTRKESKITRVQLGTADIKPNYWHHITISHTSKEFLVFVDKSVWGIEIPVSLLPRKFNMAFIGAGIDLNTLQTNNYFNGEMAVQYFYQPTILFRDAVKDVAQKAKLLTYLYGEEKNLEDHLSTMYGYMQFRNLRYMKPEFVSTTLFIIDPNVFFNITPI